MKQIARECIAYIAVKYPDTEFRASDLPHDIRRPVSGFNRAGFVTRRTDGDRRVFKLTREGMRYARSTAQTEMESYT